MSATLLYRIASVVLVLFGRHEADGHEQNSRTPVGRYDWGTCVRVSGARVGIMLPLTCLSSATSS